MSVITKKSEKMAAVAQSLSEPFTFEEFLAEFQRLYPKDWQKVVREYERHEKKTKVGKHHPMPEPIQYIRNAFNVHQQSRKYAFPQNVEYPDPFDASDDALDQRCNAMIADPKT